MLSSSIITGAAISLGGITGAWFLVSQGVSAQEVKEWGAWGAFVALVFTIGWRQVEATKAMGPKLDAVQHSLDKTVTSNEDLAAAIRDNTRQSLELNKATLANQAALTDRIMGGASSLWDKNEAVLLRLEARFNDFGARLDRLEQRRSS